MNGNTRVPLGKKHKKLNAAITSIKPKGQKLKCKGCGFIKVLERERREREMVDKERRT